VGKVPVYAAGERHHRGGKISPDQARPMRLRVPVGVRTRPGAWEDALMILDRALPPVKPGQQADFESAAAKATAGSVSSRGMPAASGPGLAPGSEVVLTSGHSPDTRAHMAAGPNPARRQVPVSAGG
jgi:hypothetical protein